MGVSVGSGVGSVVAVGTAVLVAVGSGVADARIVGRMGGSVDTLVGNGIGNGELVTVGRCAVGTLHPVSVTADVVNIRARNVRLESNFIVEL